MSNNHLTHQKSETINHQNSSWLQCLLHSSMQLRTWVPCVLPGDTKNISFSSWKQNFCSLGYISVTTHWSIFWCDTCSLHRAKTTNAIKTQHRAAESFVWGKTPTKWPEKPLSNRTETHQCHPLLHPCPALMFTHTKMITDSWHSSCHKILTLEFTIFF